MSVFDFIDYDNCITNLTSSIQKHFGLKPNYKTNQIVDRFLSEKDYENVIVFVFDGMGNSIIDKNTTNNHFLQKNRVGTLLSTFPPTTANCTTAFRSGLNPITTGWLGWSTHYIDSNMTVDNFPNVDSVTKELIEGENFAEQRLPYIPLGEIIEKESKGQVKHYSIWPSFKEGGCKSIKEFEHRVCKICNLEGKKYIYAYWDEPDKTMHPEGTSSKRVKKQLNDIGKALKNIQRKTKNTIGIVSADHSQIDVVPIAFYTYYDVLDCLKAPFSCDSRTPFFFVKEDRKEQFVELFNKYFSDKFDLYSKDEVLNNNLFGKGEKYKELDNILGDYIAIAKDKYYFLLSTNSHMFLGHHAGGVEEESSIPLIIIKN